MDWPRVEIGSPWCRKSTYTIHKDHISKTTQFVRIRKTRLFILCTATNVLYCKNNTNHIHFVGKMQSFIMLQQVVPIVTKSSNG
jgi:hypothetical protein